MLRHVQQTTRGETHSSPLNDWLLIALFCVLLLIPLVTQVVGFSTESNTEKRVLAPFPKIKSVKEIKLVPKLSEDYVNDRFGLRDQFVQLNSLLRYSLG